MMHNYNYSFPIYFYLNTLFYYIEFIIFQFQIETKKKFVKFSFYIILFFSV